MNIDLLNLLSKIDKKFEIVITQEVKTKISNFDTYLIIAKIILDDKSKTLVGASDTKENALKDLSEKLSFIIDPKHNSNEIVTPEAKENKENNQNSSFTKETITNMNNFKKSKDINNDEKLMHYINAWNPNIKHKSQLTETLVKEFLLWVK